VLSRPWQNAEDARSIDEDAGGRIHDRRQCRASVSLLVARGFAMWKFAWCSLTIFPRSPEPHHVITGRSRRRVQMARTEKPDDQRTD
jgi:hypothetical protein